MYTIIHDVTLVSNLDLFFLMFLCIQFVCPKVGEQRQQLIPVLATMLKLSPEEKTRVAAVAQGKLVRLLEKSQLDLVQTTGMTNIDQQLKSDLKRSSQAATQCYHMRLLEKY